MHPIIPSADSHIPHKRSKQRKIFALCVMFFFAYQDFQTNRAALHQASYEERVIRLLSIESLQFKREQLSLGGLFLGRPMHP